MQLEQSWDQIQVALHTSDSLGVFSSLLVIVQFMEEKKIQSSWVVESASRLDLLVRLDQTLCEVTLDSSSESSAEASSNDLKSVLSEAIVFCGTGDRHATLVKRILAKAGEDPNQNREMSLTEHEKVQLDLFWNDTEVALKNDHSKDAFISLIKIVILWDEKNCPWLNESTARLHRDSMLKDATIKELLGYCDNNTNRHASLLKEMLTKSINKESENIKGANQPSDANRETMAYRKAKKKKRTIPDHYHSVIKSLQTTSTVDSIVPSWAVLMNSHTTVNGVAKYLSLPCPPKWVDSPHDLQCLQSKLHEAINESNGKLGGERKFEKFLAFDSEFRSEGGTTELATIQFSIFEDGLPLAWVVDLNPNPADTVYSTMTCDILRWIFLESDAQILGFAHRHDLRMISSYIGEDIPIAPNFLDVQLLASHKMADDLGASSDIMSSLPGLKSCCSYFLEASGKKMNGQNSNLYDDDMKSWSLLKNEQCSNWAQRPLTANQLGYAGLDAAVLLVLLAEIVLS